MKPAPNSILKRRINAYLSKTITPKKEISDRMYPSLTVACVEKPTTLREFIKELGENYLYAFDKKRIGVLVNNRRLWPSARLKPGDRVVVFPVIVGG